MSTSPRIALIVHNRLEQDPRVSRHAQAAIRARYRAAVLSVGIQASPNGWRWGETVNGVEVFESRIVGRTWLGRLRSLASGLTSRAGGRHGHALSTAPTVDDPAPAVAPARRLLLGTAGDLITVALLLRGNLAVFRQFRGIGARLVHANDLNVLPAAYLLARAWQAPLLYDSHELWVALDAEWSPLLRRLFALLERVLIRRTAAVVTVNGAIANELARRYDIQRPVVVMNCPDAPVATSGIPDDAVARDRGPLQVIYQGMLNPNRGLLELVDAVAAVPNLQLAIRGPGALRDALQDRIHLRGVQDRVRVLPAVPMQDLVRALDGYDVGVVPYLPVGMNNMLCSPNKLFEYMSAGLAVVCSDLPVLHEVVEDARCGLLVAAGDTPAMAEALRRLAQDRALVSRLRANALAAARELYNAEHEEGKLMALYERLIGSSGQAAVSREDETGLRVRGMA